MGRVLRRRSVSRDGDGTLGSVWWTAWHSSGLCPDATAGGRWPGVFGRQDARAIKKSEKGSEPIALLVKDRDQVISVALDYHGGLRIPHLERVDGTPDRLDDVLAAQ